MLCQEYHSQTVFIALKAHLSPLLNEVLSRILSMLTLKPLQECSCEHFGQSGPSRDEQG